MASRSRAWILCYTLVAAATGIAVARRGLPRPNRQTSPPARAELAAGLALSAAGYQLGRRLLGDAPAAAPPEGAGLEVLALAGVVAPAEELVWGRLVEPAAGVVATGALFAAKHGVVDSRWRRWLGLFLFWLGLGLLRRRSATLALVVHVGCNALGVAVGHATGKDQF
jgi:hypothetical protein